MEGHGREDVFEGVDLSRTVGWFTALMPLVLSLPDNPEPGEALKSIKEQLRRVPQHGLSFGLLRYLSQDSTIVEALAALPQPEISFNYSGRSMSTSAKRHCLFRLPSQQAQSPVLTISGHTCSTSIAASPTGNCISNGLTIRICTIALLSSNWLKIICKPCKLSSATASHPSPVVTRPPTSLGTTK